MQYKYTNTNVKFKKLAKIRLFDLLYLICFRHVNGGYMWADENVYIY